MRSLLVLVRGSKIPRGLDTWNLRTVQTNKKSLSPKKVQRIQETLCVKSLNRIKVCFKFRDVNRKRKDEIEN